MRFFFEPIYDLTSDESWAWVQTTADGRVVRASRALCACGNRYGLCHPEA